MSLTNVGVYPLRQAARLVGADVASVRRWMVGYKRRTQVYPPLWEPEISTVDMPDPSIGFRDLLELRLVAAFVRHGVSLRVIRATADAAREQFGAMFPLTTQRFLTDGKAIFSEAAGQAGEPALLDVRRRQFVFNAVVRPSLYEGIEYSGSDARRWYPMPGTNRKVVVLDPMVQFGDPVVAEAGVPTDVIYASFIAEGKDTKAVARIYDLTAKQVTAAVNFEKSLAA